MQALVDGVASQAHPLGYFVGAVALEAQLHQLAVGVGEAGEAKAGEDEAGEETMAYLIQSISHGLFVAHRKWRKRKGLVD